MKKKQVKIIVKAIAMFCIVFVAFICKSCFDTKIKDKDYFTQIQLNFIKFQTTDGISNDSIIVLLTTQIPDGAWNDIEYHSKRRGSWPPLKHLYRLEYMSKAYAADYSDFYQSNALLESIVAGLNYWLDNDYKNTNWWSWKIGVPESITKIFVLLGDKLPPELLSIALNDDLKKTKMGMTGQNKVWLAGIAFLKAYLQNDTATMFQASDSIWSELKVTIEEGIQPDWSFHQHGPQQQFGNYGQHFVERMLMWGSILKNTPFAIPKEKLNVLRSYVLDGQSWILWQGNLDISACGRRLNKGLPDARAQAMYGQIIGMVSVDPQFKLQYNSRVDNSNQPLGHKSFWRSEMAVHRNSNWYASVKMSSTRVIGSETCNSENMQGLHLGDGVLLTYITGREYKDIIPLWDWHRLPGTTCDQGFHNLVPKGWNQSYGGTNYAGVVSNNKLGMAAMHYKRNKLEAKKAWFFFADRIVCLGTDIHGETSGPVYTSIEQSLLSSDVSLSAGTLSIGESVAVDKGWLYHAGIGYEVNSNFFCKTELVNGNWQDSYPTLDATNANGEVLSIWIDHEKSPKNEKYSYTIYPNVSLSDMKKHARDERHQIISNKSSAQVVNMGKTTMAAFHQKCRVKVNEDIISVSAPCLLMIGDDSVVISDPLHQQDSLWLTINNKTQVIAMPQGAEQGKPVSYKIK